MKTLSVKEALAHAFSTSVQTNLKPQKTALEMFLKDKEVGTFFSFSDLSKACGVDVLKYRDVIESAKKRLIRHHKKVLVNIRGLGYKLALSDETLEEGATYRNKAHRSAKKSVSIIETIDLSKMPETDRNKVILEKAKSCAIVEVCKAVKNPLLQDTTKIAEIKQSDVIRLLLK